MGSVGSSQRLSSPHVRISAQLLANTAMAVVRRAVVVRATAVATRTGRSTGRRLAHPGRTHRRPAVCVRAARGAVVAGRGRSALVRRHLPDACRRAAVHQLAGASPRTASSQLPPALPGSASPRSPRRATPAKLVGGHRPEPRSISLPIGREDVIALCVVRLLRDVNASRRRVEEASDVANPPVSGPKLADRADEVVLEAVEGSV